MVHLPCKHNSGGAITRKHALCEIRCGQLVVDTLITMRAIHITDRVSEIHGVTREIGTCRLCCATERQIRQALRIGYTCSFRPAIWSTRAEEICPFRCPATIGCEWEQMQGRQQEKGVDEIKHQSKTPWLSSSVHREAPTPALAPGAAG